MLGRYSLGTLARGGSSQSPGGTLAIGAQNVAVGYQANALGGHSARQDSVRLEPADKFCRRQAERGNVEDYDIGPDGGGIDSDAG